LYTFARAFSVLCGLLIVAIAARYGFKTSDGAFDGAIWAFTYGAVTLGGLFGHSLGVRAWRHSKPTGALVFAASAFALVLSLSNEIGAMAGRGSEQQAERIRVSDAVRDAHRSLKRAQEEREGLKFTAADDAAVKTAQARADAAAKAKDAECAQRGQRCRDKEAAEVQALADLAAVTNNKVATDRAAKLDADIAAFKDKIERAGPVLEVNSQGSALARLFDLPDSSAAALSTYQNFAMAVAIELIIIVWLAAAEVIEHHEKRPAQGLASQMAAARREEGISPSAVTGARRSFPAAAGRRLIASQPHPIGNVATIMADILEPGRGKVEIAELFAAYAEACAASGKRPIPANEFPATIAALCKTLGIAIIDTGKGVFLSRIKIKQPAEKIGAE
jgi:hypothetical protein